MAEGQTALATDCPGSNSPYEEDIRRMLREDGFSDAEIARELDEVPDNIQSWEHVLHTTTRYSYGEVRKKILRYAPIWSKMLGTHDAAALITHIAKAEVNDCFTAYTDALYLDRLLPVLKEHATDTRRIIRTILHYNHILPVLSFLPIEQLPRPIRSSAQKWLQPKRPELTSDIVHPIRHIDTYIGQCSMLDQGHRYTFIGEPSVFDSNKGAWFDSHGHVTLLYTNGTLVGSMKMKGDPSILGLKTIQDSSGRLPVVLGGVYGTNQQVTDAAKQAHHQQGPWAKLHLDSLPLFPTRFPWQREKWFPRWKFRRMARKIREKRDILESQV